MTKPKRNADEQLTADRKMEKLLARLEHRAQGKARTLSRRASRLSKLEGLR